MSALVFDLKANNNLARYEYLRGRGHTEFCEKARRNEDMFHGDGKMWSVAAREKMHATKRKCVEENQIRVAVSSAVGYQISNRMDISFIPRGHGADDETADTINKVVRQIADNNKLHWIETDVVFDGLISGRGYFDIRMCFDDSVTGEIEITSLPPTDVIPDYDADSYTTKGWSDVTISRFFTLDRIEEYYGADKRKLVENFKPADYDYSGFNDEQLRARFGNAAIGNEFYDFTYTDIDTRRYRVIDRQYRVYEQCDVMVYSTGDVRIIPEDTPPEKIEEWRAAGGLKTKRRMSRVKWLITCGGVTLFDDYSPYPFFTVIGFFPYFRRGRTTSMIDNAISPQEMLNKALSTGLDIFNSNAKGGLQMEQGSVTNMTERELMEKAGMPGLVIIRKPNSKPVERLESPQMPAAINDFIVNARAAIKSVTGATDELNAENSEKLSGQAIQARQFAAQQRLAIPLDNLARTRHELATCILWMVQTYMGHEQVIRITEKDSLGKSTTRPIELNKPMPDGSYLNDLTVGEYDVAISEQPLAVTFDNTQFNQMEVISELLQKQGDTVPAEWLIRYSNIADKSEFVKAINDARAAKAQTPPDPLRTAQADLATAKAETERLKAEKADLEKQLMQAQIDKTRNEATQAGVVAIYSATQAGAEVAAMPNIAGISDEILASAGFVDQNAPPIIPIDGAGLAGVAPPVPTINAPPARTNTDPLTPPSPRIGADRGIEKPGVQ